VNWQFYLMLGNAATDLALKIYNAVSNNPDTPDAVKVALAAQSAQLAATRAAVEAFQP
jgi:hypothetical protein